MEKAWIVEYAGAGPWDGEEQTHELVRAPTRGKAIASSLDGDAGFDREDWKALRAYRMPTFDDLPMTPWNLIVHADIYSWYECQGECSNQCWRDYWIDERTYDEIPYDTADGLPWRDGEEGGAIYCSRRCLEDDVRKEEQSVRIARMRLIDPYLPAEAEKGWRGVLPRLVLAEREISLPFNRADREEWGKMWALVRVGPNGPLARLRAPAPCVVHVGDGIPDAVYIGRENGRKRLKRSIWHNPFKITEQTWRNEEGEERRSGNTREDVLRLYEAHLRSSPDLLARIPDLLGKPLACWCRHAPEAGEIPRQSLGTSCHGDVLVKYVVMYEHYRANGLEWPPADWRAGG